jgi:hypothetical protein
MQWWNAEPNKLRYAYYRNLRVNYDMPALEAWQVMKRVDAQYPWMLRDPIRALRVAIRRNHRV